MKKVIFFFLLSLATMPLQLTAQVNPQKGYVITNEGDTIRGTIDGIMVTEFLIRFPYNGRI